MVRRRGWRALAHANEDSAFRAVFTTILDERLRTKRDRKLLEEWTAGPPHPLTSRLTRRRPIPPRHVPRDGPSWTWTWKRFPAPSFWKMSRSSRRMPRCSRRKSPRPRWAPTGPGKALRRRDDHWRIKTGELLLAHAGDNDEFRQTLDKIFEQRIARTPPRAARPVEEQNRARNDSPTGCLPPSRLETAAAFGTVRGERSSPTLRQEPAASPPGRRRDRGEDARWRPVEHEDSGGDRAGRGRCPCSHRGTARNGHRPSDDPRRAYSRGEPEHHREVSGCRRASSRGVSGCRGQEVMSASPSVNLSVEQPVRRSGMAATGSRAARSAGCRDRRAADIGSGRRKSLPVPQAHRSPARAS